MISHVKSQRLLIVDPSLRDRRGHNLDYARLVVADAQAAGFNCRVFAHANSVISAAELGCPIDRHFTRAHTDPPVIDTAARFFKQHFGNRVYRVARGIRRALLPTRRDGDAAVELSRVRPFLNEVGTLLTQLSPSRDDRIFFPNLLWSEAAELARMLDSKPFANGAEVQIMMRFDPPTGDFAKRTLAEAGKTMAVTWLADTDALVEIYTHLLQTPVLRAPIPVDGPALRSAALARSQPNPVVVVALGESRREKGFLLLPDLIARILEQDSDVRFKVQASLNMPGGEPGIGDAISRLRSMEGPNLALLPPQLSSNQFIDILGTSHVLLIPYEASSYSKRSSGLLLNGLAAGLWIVAPDSATALVSCIEQNQRQNQAILCKLSDQNYEQGLREAITRARKGSPVTLSKLAEELIAPPWTQDISMDTSN